MPEQRRAEGDLDRFWDQVAQGERAEEIEGLDPEQAASIRRFQALAQAPVPGLARERVWTRLAWTESITRTGSAADQAVVIDSPGRSIGPNGRVVDAPGRMPAFSVSWPRRRWRWPVAQVATALLLLVTFLGVFVVFRSERRDDLPLAGPGTEVLAEVSVDALPAGDFVHVYVGRWFVQPGVTANIGSDSPTIGRIEKGQLAVRIGDEPERVLGPGEVFMVDPGTPYAVRVIGDDQAVYLEVQIASVGSYDNYLPFAPGQALHVLVAYHRLPDPVPPGPSEVALVRLTLEPGERLEGTADEEYYRTLVVESGTLGIDYLRTGDVVAPEATPAYEQTVQVAPGRTAAGVENVDPAARRIVGNVGEEPLVLLAVRITPIEAPFMAAADEATP